MKSMSTGLLIELIEKIENAIQNYFWSGAGMIEVRKYLT